MIGLRKISGKSMEPTFAQGDFVIVQKFCFKPRVNNIIIAKTVDGEVIKRIKKIKEKVYYLKGDNSNSAEYTINKKQIMGKIIKKIK
ncbi:MAG: hypothetical protein GON13_01050 [Nanoarchaeota archaeon]|nr:hypothetical protein [Nanoarchaeota archaeon]